jgi:hypothetical protein
MRVNLVRAVSGAGLVTLAMAGAGSAVGPAAVGRRAGGPGGPRPVRRRVGVVRLAGQLQRRRVPVRQRGASPPQAPAGHGHQPENGVWGKAEEVPGAAALNTGGQALVFSVSCASPGNCSAGGYYLGHSGFQQGFVVSQAQRHLGQGASGPRPGGPNRGAFALVSSVLCASTGNCIGLHIGHAV